MHYQYYGKQLALKLQSGITLAILTFQPLFPNKYVLSDCGENLNKIGEILLRYRAKPSNVDGMTG